MSTFETPKWLIDAAVARWLRDGHDQTAHLVKHANGSPFTDAELREYAKALTDAIQVSEADE